MQQDKTQAAEQRQWGEEGRKVATPLNYFLSICLVWGKTTEKVDIAEVPKSFKTAFFRELKELKATDWFREPSWGKTLGETLIFFLFTFWAPTQKWHWWVIKVFRSLVGEAAWLTEKPQKDILPYSVYTNV